MNHSKKIAFAETGGTNRGAVGRDFAGPAPDLLIVIDLWDALPEDVRSRIRFVVRAACE